MRIALLVSILVHAGLFLLWGRPQWEWKWRGGGEVGPIVVSPLGRGESGGKPRTGRKPQPGRTQDSGKGGGSGTGQLGPGEVFLWGNSPPLYPREALEREWQGTTVLQLRLDSEGRVKEVAVEKSSGHPVLDEAAKAAAAAWTIPDSRLARSLRVPVEFRLE